MADWLVDESWAMRVYTFGYRTQVVTGPQAFSGEQYHSAISDAAVKQDAEILPQSQFRVKEPRSLWEIVLDS